MIWLKINLPNPKKYIFKEHFDRFNAETQNNRLYLTKDRLLCSRIFASKNGVPTMGSSTEVRHTTTTDMHFAVQRTAQSTCCPMADWIKSNSLAIFGHRNTHGLYWRIRVEKFGQMVRQRRAGKLNLHRRRLLQLRDSMRKK